jgi:hypothetical protein
MRSSFIVLIAAALIGGACFAQADDGQRKSDKPKCSDSGRVEGLFINSDGGARCRELCGRAHRPGYELSNDICIATCMHYPR